MLRKMLSKSYLKCHEIELNDQANFFKNFAKSSSKIFVKKENNKQENALAIEKLFLSLTCISLESFFV